MSMQKKRVIVDNNTEEKKKKKVLPTRFCDTLCERKNVATYCIFT